jgi:hypothetical protein
MLEFARIQPTIRHITPMSKSTRILVDRLVNRREMQNVNQSVKTIILVLLSGITAFGGEPSIIFDNRPESGIPLDAMTQTTNESADAKSHATLSELMGSSIKTVRVRYFSPSTWIGEHQRDYLAGLLTNKFTASYTFQIWSQLVGEPEIECLIDFTDECRNKVYAEHKLYHEGRLLIWGTVACYRDAAGRWWYVTLFDYYHAHHPSGQRELSREKSAK